jgi:pimeloyl-ACP methyl ester carboxylesterase
MNPLEPFVREAGSGPGVICLHSNASTSGQWRALIERLAPRFHAMAIDSYGAGKSPEWPLPRPLTLADEAALLDPLLSRVSGPLAMVGHSYGGAIALIAALAHRQRVRALVVYEPTLFALIEAQRPAPNEADGIRDAVHVGAAAVDAGDTDRAARAFIDYWMGEGTWDATPPSRKPPIAASMVHLRRWAHALFAERTPLADFARLDMPVLYLCGKQTRVSARGVMRALLPVLPHARVQEFDGVGHMGPITHPEPINAAIERFLDDVHR